MRKRLPICAGIMLGTLLPAAAHALGIDPCPLGSLACPGGAADTYLAVILTNGAKVAFAGVLAAMLVYYGFMLVIGSDNESTVGDVYKSYTYAMIGTVLAGGAFFFADTFAVPERLVVQTPTNTVVTGIISAIRALLLASLAFNIFYQGYRLVSSQDEGQAEKAKKQFVYGMVGAAIVILADRGVAAFTGVDVSIINTEAVGIANFLGTILGAFAIIALFVAGLWLVFAVNEQNKDKAKKIISAVFIVLAVAMASLALVRITFTAWS